MKKGITVNTDNSNFNRNLFKKNFFPKIMNCVFKANFNLTLSKLVKCSVLFKILLSVKTEE